MIIAALVVFGALLVAWLLAPVERTGAHARPMAPRTIAQPEAVPEAA